MGNINLVRDLFPQVTLYGAAQATYMWPQVRNFVQPNSIYLNLLWQDVWLAQ